MSSRERVSASETGWLQGFILKCFRELPGRETLPFLGLRGATRSGLPGVDRRVPFPSARVPLVWPARPGSGAQGSDLVSGAKLSCLRGGRGGTAAGPALMHSARQDSQATAAGLSAARRRLPERPFQTVSCSGPVRPPPKGWPVPAAVYLLCRPELHNQSVSDGRESQSFAVALDLRLDGMNPNTVSVAQCLPARGSMLLLGVAEPVRSRACAGVCCPCSADAPLAVPSRLLQHSRGRLHGHPVAESVAQGLAGGGRARSMGHSTEGCSPWGGCGLGWRGMAHTVQRMCRLKHSRCLHLVLTLRISPLGRGLLRRCL